MFITSVVITQYIAIAVILITVICCCHDHPLTSGQQGIRPVRESRFIGAVPWRAVSRSIPQRQEKLGGLPDCSFL